MESAKKSLGCVPYLHNGNYVQKPCDITKKYVAWTYACDSHGHPWTSRHDRASEFSERANPMAQPTLPHTIARISPRPTRMVCGSPRQAQPETSNDPTCAAQLSSHTAHASKSRPQHSTTGRQESASRRRDQLSRACQGVKQAHAVSGFEIGESVRAWEAGRPLV